MTLEPDTSLSIRLRQILILAANGNTQQQTADQLHLSVPTVQGSLRRIHRLLGARNTPHAIRLALYSGQLDLWKVTIPPRQEPTPACTLHTYAPSP